MKLLNKRTFKEGSKFGESKIWFTGHFEDVDKKNKIIELHVIIDSVYTSFELNKREVNDLFKKP